MKRQRGGYRCRCLNRKTGPSGLCEGSGLSQARFVLKMVFSSSVSASETDVVGVIETGNNGLSGFCRGFVMLPACALHADRPACALHADRSPHKFTPTGRTQSAVADTLTRATQRDGCVPTKRACPRDDYDKTNSCDKEKKR